MYSLPRTGLRGPSCQSRFESCKSEKKNISLSFSTSQGTLLCLKWNPKFSPSWYTNFFHKLYFYQDMIGKKTHIAATLANCVDARVCVWTDGDLLVDICSFSSLHLCQHVYCSSSKNFSNWRLFGTLWNSYWWWHRSCSDSWSTRMIHCGSATFDIAAFSKTKFYASCSTNRFDFSIHFF